MKYIKEYIRQQNETISSFAKKLHLSRPTLDTYIITYEADKSLPKKKYQIIFDYLFQDLTTQKGIFSGRLEMCSKLLEKEEKFNVWELSSKKIDYVSQILNKVKEDLSNTNCDEELYMFIDILISNYNQEFFQNLVRYFLTLNGYKDEISVTEQQKAFFAKIYKTFYECSQSSIIYNINDYEAFGKHCAEIRREKENKKIVEKNKHDQLSDIELSLLQKLGGNRR